MERTKRWIRRHFLRIFLLTGILLLGACGVRGVTAVERDPDISTKDIGRMYTEKLGEKAVVGVQVFTDSSLRSYAYDVWKYAAKYSYYWEFQYNDIQGSSSGEMGVRKFPSGYIQGLDPKTSGARFEIPASFYKSLVEGSCYMIETTTFQKGQELKSEVEYSPDVSEYWADQEYSLMRAMEEGKKLNLVSADGTSKSYEYHIKSGVYIGEGQSVSTYAPGAAVIGRGEAYYCEEGQYKIRKLPTASKPSDQNRYVFLGWYADLEGGRKISVGDCVHADTRLFAHWEAVEQRYDVTCIDVCRGEDSEIILGSSQWQAGYGENVSGSQAGCDMQPGSYYVGRQYTGCSSTTVQGEETTVYRYFNNAPMTVTCIDVVNIGPDTGQKLGTTVWEAPYSSIVQGSKLGCDEEAGAYYRGYQYKSSTSQLVSEKGCTVYRYFTPIMYDIEFVANCKDGGRMSVLKNCYYGHSYQLTANSFINKNIVNLSLNAQDATCDTAYQSVYLDFAGWSDSQEGGVLYSDECMVKNLLDSTGSVKLYAIWSDKEVFIDAQPKRQGYEFAGWSQEQTAQHGKRQFQIGNDILLYAVWQAAPAAYHVEYYKQRLNQGYDLAAQYDFSAKTGSVASIGEVEEIYPGFQLDKASSKLSGQVKADGTLILNAYFRRGAYTVNFHPNGGKVVSDGETLRPVTGLFEQTVNLPDCILERKGYLFTGWTLEPDSQQAVGKAGGEYSIPNHNQTLYACWTPRDDTTYSVIPYYENLNGIGYIKGEKLDLPGTTGTTLEESLLFQYPAENIHDSLAKLFGKGYILSEDAEKILQNKISANGDTTAELYLLRRRYELRFLVRDSGNRRVVATQAAVYGQSYRMPQKIEGIAHIYCYQDTSGKSYYPGDVIEIAAKQDYVVYRSRQEASRYGAGQTPGPESKATPGPSQGSQVTPGSGTAVTVPGVKVSDSPDSTPSGSEIPVRTSAPPMPEKTPEMVLNPPTVPVGTTAPGQTDIPDVPEEGMSVISTWSGTDKDKISSRLARNANAAFLKKGSRIKRKGVLYQVLQSNSSKRTLQVTGLTKQHNVVKIPDQIRCEGYTYRVTQIKKEALSGQKKLKKIVLGKNIRKIGKNAFANNRRLNMISFHTKGKIKIGAGAWKGCPRTIRIHLGKECSQSCRRSVIKMNARMK